MAHRPKRGLKADIKGPLIIAAVLGVVAFVGVSVFGAGGTDNAAPFRLALSAAGGVFVVTLVVCATLIIVEKPNDEDLGQGTGVNRRSADLYAEARERKRARERAEAQGSGNAGNDAGGSAAGSDQAKPQDEEPRYGQRARPEDHN
ncbi:hypothetical protein NBM05_07810 [Rothia sp. AR01]|uniref:Uncharacterized protein n=1 Tax=Rothia santali TaxID=2949643 RepID=A0A9X2HES7_9MICC|nr:hypothetical protein [Rothia santali]MCP3425914.1 hypothetical protein [Rothia santali]